MTSTHSDSAKPQIPQAALLALVAANPGQRLGSVLEDLAEMLRLEYQGFCRHQDLPPAPRAVEVLTALVEREGDA